MRQPTQTKRRIGLICANDPINEIDLYGLDPLGHHYVPRSIWKDLSDRVQKIWDDPKNRLDAKDYTKHNGKPYNGVKCKDYAKAVGDKLKDFLKSLGKKSADDLSDEQLQEFADDIKTSDGDIGAYNAGVAEEITATTEATASAAETVEVLEVVADVDEAIVITGAIVK